MKDMIKKGIATLVLAFIVITGGTAVAIASENVGGGVWSHGVDINVWSDYYHSQSNHSSTACNNSDCDRKTSGPGGESKAWKITNPLTSHSVYWDVW